MHRSRFRAVISLDSLGDESVQAPEPCADHALRARWLERVPVWLYRARLGILLGPRFLLLEHTGRKTGTVRHTLLEVIGRPAPGTYVVVSRRGELAQWFRNVRVNPLVRVYAGSRPPAAAAARVILPSDEAVELLDDPVSAAPVVILEPRTGGQDFAVTPMSRLRDRSEGDDGKEEPRGVRLWRL